MAMEAADRGAPGENFSDHGFRGGGHQGEDDWKATLGQGVQPARSGQGVVLRGVVPVWKGTFKTGLGDGGNAHGIWIEEIQIKNVQCLRGTLCG